MTIRQHVFFWIFIILLTALTLYGLRGILLPFIVGGILAYALNPLVIKLERVKCPRFLGSILTLCGILLLLAVIVILVAPVIHSEFVQLVHQIPSYGNRLTNITLSFIDKLADYLPQSEREQITKELRQSLGAGVHWLATFLIGIFSGGLAIANTIALTVITPIVAFYLLKDWPHVVSKIDSLLPRKQAPLIRSEIRQIDQTVSGYAKGQLIVCLILGLYYAFSLSLVGLDFAILLGIMTGILCFIPYLGVFIGFMIAFSVALSKFGSWTPIWWVITIFIVGSASESYALTPRFVGERLGLNPLWIIFSVMAGAYMQGLIGAIIALPSAAVISVLVRSCIKAYLKSSYYHNALLVEKKPLLINDNE